MQVPRTLNFFLQTSYKRHQFHLQTAPTLTRQPSTSSTTMEQFTPHPKSRFEGFYSKFDLPSGSHLALIICTVPKATKLAPHMVNFTYYPTSRTPIFQREH